MKFTLALVFASVSAVIASPAVAPIEKRCGASGVNWGVIDTILAAARAKGVSDWSKTMVATFETGRVESNYNNLNCGDKDSLGVFQQRPSQGWGSAGQILDVWHSANSFLDVAIRYGGLHGEKWSGSAGTLAQKVQGSELPWRYDQEESYARNILSQAIQRAGGSSSGGSGGAINVGNDPHHSSSGSSGSSHPSTSSGSSSGCAKHYTVKHGDTCSKLAGMGGISLSKFYSLNGAVNSACSNLNVGQTYCIAAGASSSASSSSHGSVGVSKGAVPSNLASGTTKSCSEYYTVHSGDICSKLMGMGHMSLSSLRTLNGGINSACSNLTVGKAYCVKA